MRLTCPNCGAQYEVPDEVIPETGRDVQCSNCGDTWFQNHKDHVPEDEGETPDDTGPQDTDWEDVDPPARENPPPAAEDFAPPPPPNDEDDSAEVDAPPPLRRSADTKADAPERPARPERREIDPAVTSVLREEAEREARARAAAQGGLETQPDLNLPDDEARRARESRQRMARMRGLDPDDPPTPKRAAEDDDDGYDIDPKSRRSLFPDIEEINSSLGPEPPAFGTSEDETDAYPEAEPHPRGGFGRGFFVAVLIALVALLVYLFAADLVNALPALRDVLADYVTWVDGLRGWLDGQIAALMLWLDAMIGGAPAADTGG
ncbi:zinc-ribbon domain-containing protein [Roseovarius nanhaiticus]|uniref:zinc-ribbon domain-containing protein n=1 Tax=Roseovarius nanhaiticus TaxID=573024 RepID=UPI00248F9829|nr:zinc-ribbon domain-containing protein [Roseovarius nanhaiticus]